MFKNSLFGLFVLVIFVGCGDTVTTTNDYVSVELHNQGLSCLDCHGVGGSEADNVVFTSGGSVYTTLTGDSSDSFASGYTIRLVLESTDTEVNYVSGNGTANSYTEYINSINNFTAQVIDANGNVVNSSNLNSHDGGNLDCNSCHTSTGDSEVPGRIVSYDYYN